jgi:hypothetical protein
VNIDYSDQRSNKVTEIAVDMDNLYILCEKAGVPDGTQVRVRVRDEKGRYGFTEKHSWGYRVVVNVNYSKPQLSEAAQYVVNNTLLHELRHVAQGAVVGWHKLSGDYHGWSEVEAREYGKKMQGEDEFYALR